MSASSLARNAVQFAMNIVIAKFISPSEYGLVVFTAPFLALIGLMTDMGMSSAVVRQEQMTPRQAGAAWTLTVLLGAVLAGGLALAAFPLQGAVRMAGLGPVAMAMSGVIMLSISAAVPRALLERQLRYNRIAMVETVTMLGSAAIGVALAFLHFGVWSLVGYNLINQGARAAAFLWLSRGRLQPNLALGQTRPLLSFGGWVLANNLLTFFARNSDNLLIGAVLGAAAVGLYGLAYQFMLAPLMALTWPTSAILFSMLSRQGANPAAMRRAVSGVVSVTAMLSFPAMAYLTFGMAFPFAALLSSHWQGSAPIVALLAPVGALQSVSSYSGAILLSLSKSRLQFLLTVANTLACVLAFVLSLPFGLHVLVMAYMGVASLMAVAILVVVVLNSPVTWRDLARALAPACIATGVGLALAGAVSRFHVTDWSGWLQATIAFGLGALGVYALMARRIGGVLSVLVAPMSREAA